MKSVYFADKEDKSIAAPPVCSGGMKGCIGMESQQSTSSGSFAGMSIHMIGIGGSGMRAVSRMLLEQGAKISGSDRAMNSTVESLIEAGASVKIGQQAENIPGDCTLAVYSAAINPQNPEFEEAQRRGVELIKYSQMLGRLMQNKMGLAIAGTHGKSTTTGMISYALKQAGMDPSFVVGAMVDQLGGPSGVGRGEHFVAEACEFDRSFLNLSPKLATILNLEEDHLDCYRNLDAIIEAFRAFTAKIPADGVMIANGEDRNVLEAVRDAACLVETFGLTENCVWRGVNPINDGGRFRMDVLRHSEPFCELRPPLPGLHNAYNSLAAVAMLYHAGLKPSQISEHLQGYQGARRRMTLVGQAGGVTVLDDFAHHPTEIQASLRAMANVYQPRRLLCVFQPHQHSRTRFLLKDFASSFALANEVIVPDIYFVRDSEKEKDHISSKDLVAQIRMRGGVAIYLKSFDLIVEYLKGVMEDGDLVVTMGAGNVWEVADELVKWLKTNR